MTSIHETALELADAGYSVLPIRPDGTKAPAGAWKQYTQQAASPEQVDTWFRDTTHDIAVIQGAVSGGAELTELEAAATNRLTDLHTHAVTSGISDLWDRLVTGWLESSPSGGLHIHYRITDGPVPGNTKIARTADHKVLAETRGENGYVIVAPSSHHSSGRAWTRLIGGPATAPTITRAERDAFHKVLADILDEQPPTPPTPKPDKPAAQTTSAPAPTGELSPGDDYNARATWDDILTPHGWQKVHPDGKGWAWTRPDKNPRDGISATTGTADSGDRLYVFSTSTPFDPEVPYSKFGAYAVLNHGGNMSAAARQLAKDGYGTKREPDRLTRHDAAELTTHGNLATVTPIPTPDKRPIALVNERTLQRSDDANALELIDRFGTTIRHVHDRGRWIAWNGHQWEWCPTSGGIVREYAKRVARSLPEDDQPDITHKKASLSAKGVTAMIQQAETDDRIQVGMDQLDAHPHELNTPGGIVNLETGTLEPADPARLHTRSTAVTPERAPTPRWTQFLADTFAGHEDVIPYVQELAGYSLIGRVTHHVLPFLHGPGGNGKSVFLDVLRSLTGDYAATTPSKFLMANTNQHETEIARLSGLRLVITSEVNQTDKFDEAKVKLLTGGDALTARFMRQDHFTFTPTHHLWLMGNHQPRVTSGGGESFWRRLRLIPFTNIVPEEKRIDDLDQLLIIEEGPGILQWAIDGAVNILANGMNAPESVLVATQEYATEEDTFSRFITDRCILTDNSAARTETSTLRAAYTTWCDREGEKPLSPQVFGRELRARHGIDQHRSNGKRFYLGILLAADEDEPDDTTEEWWNR